MTVSKSKDRQRYGAMRRLNPDYAGFRGHDEEPTQPGKAPLQSLVCVLCGRKRNVLLGIALEQGARYVCLACREQEQS